MDNIALKGNLITYISPEPYLEGHASYTHVKEMIDELSNLGWKITNIHPNYSKSKSVLSRVLKLTILNYKAIIDKNKFIYIRWHVCLFPFVFFNYFFKKTIFIEVNGKIEDLFIAWKFTRYFKSIIFYLMKYQLEKAYQVITVTPGLLKYCHDKLGIEEEKIKCISNGVNIKLFNPQAKYLEIKLDFKLPIKYGVLFGSLTEWQGVREVIASINSDYWDKDCAVLFIGNGREVDFIKQSALKNHLILYSDPVEYKKIARIVARAAFSFVCGVNLRDRASNGLAPLKLFESMACGVPIIATDIPFQATIIKNSNSGLVITDNTPKTIATAVRFLLDNRDLSNNFGLNGSITARMSHSWAFRAKELDTLLRAI